MKTGRDRCEGVITSLFGGDIEESLRRCFQRCAKMKRQGFEFPTKQLPQKLLTLAHAQGPSPTLMAIQRAPLWDTCVISESKFVPFIQFLPLFPSPVWVTLLHMETR